MPLIMMCGHPGSGKTTRANQLAEYLRANGDKQVVIINEESLGIKREDGYQSSFLEKQSRGALKAAIERNVSKDVIVIADSLNYIKGYRYELYCIARAAPTPHCVVFCDVPEKKTQLWNSTREGDKWPEKLMSELIMRFEKPNSNNRWDSPCWTVKSRHELPLEEIGAFVLSNKPNSTQVLATHYSKAEDTNYLYDLDKITQDIITAVLDAQNTGTGTDVIVPKANKKVKLVRTVTIAELRRIRKQYITFAKQMSTMKANYSKEVEIGDAFVDYLNTSLNADK